MNTKQYIIYKVYATRKGAEAYIMRYGITAEIEVIDGRFFIVA